MRFFFLQAHTGRMEYAASRPSSMKENVQRAQTGVQLASLIKTVLNVTATTTVLSANTHVHKIVKIFVIKNLDTAHTVVQMAAFPNQTLRGVLSVRHNVKPASL